MDHVQHIRNFGHPPPSMQLRLTGGPGDHDTPVEGSVGVLEGAVLVEAADDEAHVDEDQDGGEREVLRVVPHVGD